MVASNERHKRRMVVDYSRTINRYIDLDAFPIPRVEKLAHKMEKHKVYDYRNVILQVA